MDTLLLLLGFVCMLIGVLGSFLPVLPGISISWLGLVLLYFTHAVATNYWVLGGTLIVAILISVLDYVIPSRGAKKFGGSSYGARGTTIGLLLGLFIPIPFGIFIGAFLGAFAGELIYDSKQGQRAFKAATGSILGLLLSTFMQFLISILFLGLFIEIVWQNRAVLF